MTTADKDKPTRKAVDWEAVERDYRTGVLSLRELGEKHGCSEGAIRKRAKKAEQENQPWARDLEAKVQARADDLVRKAEVRAEVRSTQVVSEREVIEANAHAITTIRLGHRADISKARELAMELLGELKEQVDNRELLTELGDRLRMPDDKGNDKLNDLYMQIIGLPERTKTMKALADTLKTLIALEREAWNIGEPVDPEAGKVGKTLSDAERASRLASILTRAQALADAANA